MSVFFRVSRILYFLSTYCKIQQIEVNIEWIGLIFSRVICRQRYYLAGVKQRRQFLKEISVQEALQTRALSGVRVHREFCNPVINPPVAEEIVTLTREERRRLEKVLVTKY